MHIDCKSQTRSQTSPELHDGKVQEVLRLHCKPASPREKILIPIVHIETARGLRPTERFRLVAVHVTCIRGQLVLQAPHRRILKVRSLAVMKNGETVALRQVYVRRGTLMDVRCIGT
jgi:hypothetical protein